MTQVPTTENLNLDQFSDADLKAELKRREDEKKRQILDQREKNAEFWHSKINHILELVPEHSRTTCSDNDPANEYRCNRCYLLYAQKYDWDRNRELVIRINQLREL